jgi:hypothetical protein
MRPLICTAAALAFFTLPAAPSAEAADVAYRPYRTAVPAGPYYAAPYYYARPCSIDILCHVAVYPGFRGTPRYACRTVSVRETRPDGSIVIRRARVC